MKEKYPELEIQNNAWNLIKNPKTGKPLEIDILIKQGDDIICGVEYNGTYWHDKENPVKEELKTQLCEEKGIKLFHIWEDDEETGIKDLLEFLEEKKIFNSRNAG